MAKRIQVGGRIESKEVGGIVTGAAEILDDAKGKKQSVINGETDDELVRLDQSKQDNLTFDNAPTEGSENPVKSGGVYAADKALSDAIEAILLLIPSAASALNKLVDTAMMNSSISTATATFRGTYNVVTDLSLTIDATHEQIATALGNVISTADNNDYAFVQVPVSAESTDIRRTERYKSNGTAWGYEYDLNTSGFTAAQWAAINSGITLALVGKLIGLPTSSELQALLGQKQDTLTFDNIPVSGSANPVKSGGVYSAINEEKTAREQLAQTVTGIDGRVGDVEKVIPTGAAANNKLVANNSMEAYVTSIIEAITASFTIATADGHINLTLTQTNGRVASLTLTSSDIASAQALTALTGRVSTAEGNITSLGGRVSTNETDIANLQQLYNGLQQSKPVPVTALPETGQQQGVIYRLAGTTSYSDYMWNGSTWVLMATYNNAIDPRPKKASQDLVTSGGVFDNMGALDVSELNATENPHTLAQYVDLSAALAAIPTDYQKGGMSIKFVQSSDNNYIQYRLISDSFTTNTDKWAICGTCIYKDYEDWLYVVTDNIGRILFGSKKNGNFYAYNLKEDKLEILNGVEYIESTEWLYAVDDKNNRILFGVKKDGDVEAYSIISKYISSRNIKADYIEADNAKFNKNGIISIIDEINKNIATDIKTLYPKETTGVILKNLKFGKHQWGIGQYVDWENHVIDHPIYTPLSLIWFSDIHENADNLSRIKSFYDYYSEYIDDLLFTGDAMLSTYRHDLAMSYWGSIEDNNILFTIGNHDACTQLSPFTPVSPKVLYTDFIQPYLEFTDINHVQDKLYWYKDYTDAKSPECPNGLRLISLDQYHWKEKTYIGSYVPDIYSDGTSVDSGQQETWLINLLEDSRQNGYAVMIAIHGPNTDCTGIQCSFDTPDKEMVSNAEYAQIHDDMFTCVKNFIDAGGEFICWLTGHMHQDWVKYADDFPNQLVLSIDTASFTMQDRSTFMVEGTKSMDRFNIISFDSWRKYIRLFRIGIDFDRHGRHIGSLVYDYKNKQLISNY